MSFPRFLVLSASTLGVLVWALGAPRMGLGQNAVRSTSELLKSEPFDEITLIDRTTLRVEPISPRPLPPYDPAKDKSKEKDADAKPRKGKRERDPDIPFEGNIQLPGEKPRPVPKKKGAAAAAEEEPQINEITIHLLEGETRDFTLRRASIQKITYFEDMLLTEAERLIQVRDFARAFECCLRVQERNPGWKGLDDRINHLLFAEGSEALINNDGERGMRLLRELLGRKPDYPGLADKIAASYGDRISRALGLGLYMKGRRILHELDGLAPNHQVVRDVTNKYVGLAKGWVAKAEKLKGPERLDALSEALRIWPKLDGADRLYTESFVEVPTLDVGVDDTSGLVGPWVRSPADERLARLLFVPILARDDDDGTQGKIPAQLAESMTSGDLGKRLNVKLRSNFKWSDGSRPASAIDVARTLTDRTEPSSPLYNARWADLLEKIDTPEEFRVEIRLTRPFLKPGSWLLGPVGPAHAGFDGRVATLDQGRQLVGDGPFGYVTSSPGRLELHLAGGASAANDAKVRRIREFRQPTGKAAIGALIRGEVTLIDHVPPDRVPGLAQNPEIKIGKFSRPSVHLIALDGRNPALRKRELRRGISYAVNRKVLLEETILKRPPDAGNAVSDGPFAKGNYADAPEVKPLAYDPFLARMLVAAAQKELGGQQIRLTFAYPAIPEAQAVVPKIVEALKIAGLDIVLAERPESELEADIRAGKRFDLAYRATRCEEPILEVGPILCPCYDAAASADPLAAIASSTIRWLLLQLERAPDFPTAKGIAIQIDRECATELPAIPLWQVDTHYAWRTRLKGPAEVADRLYQGIETWEIEPWFAKDPW